MKLRKITRVILIGALIGALGVFTSSTLSVIKAENNKESIIKKFSIKSMFSEQMIQFSNGTKSRKLMEDAEQLEKAARLEADNAAAQAKQEMSRGGSGLVASNSGSKALKKSDKATKSSKAADSGTSNNTAPGKIDEVDLFSRLVSAEAEGESFEGQLAVATVIINRVNSPEFPKSISGVIYDKSWGYQFTPVLDGRINLPASESAKKAVAMVLGGYRSFGADVTYFLNPKKAVSTWIINHKTFFKTIGNHDFYH